MAPDEGTDKSQFPHPPQPRKSPAHLIQVPRLPLLDHEPITTTQSACRKVLSRCANAKLVLLAISKRIAFCVLASVMGSIALVASSRIRIIGSKLKALANQINGRCPSDKPKPRSPTSALSPSGFASTVYKQSSFARDSRISTLVVPGFTTRMFSRILSAKR